MIEIWKKHDTKILLVPSLNYDIPAQYEKKRRKKIRQIKLPIRHGGNGLKGLDEGTVGISTTVLQASQGGREQVRRGTIRLGGNDGGEATVSQERIRRAADTNRVIVPWLIGEGSPFGGLVYGMSLENKTALGADGVSGGVVEHNLGWTLAIWTERVSHVVILGSPFRLGCVGVLEVVVFVLCFFFFCWELFGNVWSAWSYPVIRWEGVNFVFAVKLIFIFAKVGELLVTFWWFVD